LADRTQQEWEAVLENIRNGYVPIGGKTMTYESGIKCMSNLKSLGAWKDGDFVVDIGCGNGRLAIPLTEANGIKYFGIDPIIESVKFCKEAFSIYGSFSFEHLDVRNAFYNPSGKTDPCDFKIGIPSDTADFVIFSSVLTHIGDEISCKRYMDEAKRILKSGGKLYVTWFRSLPNEEDFSCERTAFKESFIINQIKDFVVEHTWGGLTTGYNDQWAMILKKGESLG